MSTSPTFFDELVLTNLPGTRFLDVGAGHGKWGALLKCCRWTENPYVAGVDLFEPHVERLKSEHVYDEVHCASALKLPFPDKSFDSTIACEIIEHLPREDGPKLFAELRRVSRKAFVITTPNFSCLRGGGDTLDGFNEHEAHLYNYSYSEFRNLGFTKVVGSGRLKMRPYRLSIALYSLGHYFPALSRYLMGFWFSEGNERMIVID